MLRGRGGFREHVLSFTEGRALMERFIRFVQAHDLSKKNAESTQKLAQESMHWKRIGGRSTLRAWTICRCSTFNFDCFTIAG